MGRWGDGEMGEIFIKGNYPDMILKAISANKDCTSFIAFIIAMRYRDLFPYYLFPGPCSLFPEPLLPVP